MADFRSERLARRRARLEHRLYGHGGVVAGVILAGIGVLLLLQNLGIPYFEDLERYWPLILIVVGAVQIGRCWGWGGKIWGAAVIAVGCIFLASNFGYIHGDVWRFIWPGILILVGLGMLAKNIDRHANGGFGGPPGGFDPHRFAEDLKNRIVDDAHARAEGRYSREYSPHTVNEWAIFSGIKRRIDTQDFQGGEVFAMFGGVELDLRKAGTTREEVIIEVNAIFGGVEVRAPETWNITVRGIGAFGGYEDKTMRMAPDVKAPHLIVHGFAAFGGVTIQN